MEKIQLGTPDGTAENVDRLAELFPQAVTEAEADDGSITRAIDFDALRDLLGDVAEGTRERYQFTWPGKAEAKAEARRPITKTMPPEKGKSKDWDTTQNLYIEGDNLDALKILKETYAGKVKLIYIDPPYNTGHDFVYDDDFARIQSEYKPESGEYNEEGGRLVPNTEGNGRFHSDWCSMMYPRLILARELLSDDGAIFISIDDNEVGNLRKICDEMFGPNNFLAQITWNKRYTRSNNAKLFTSLTDWILAYRKSPSLSTLKESRTDKTNSIYSNPDNDPRGPWTSVSYVNPATKDQRPNLSYPLYNPISGNTVIHPTNAWKYERTTYETHVSEGRLYWGKDGTNTYPRLKKFLSEMVGAVPTNLWSYSEVGSTDIATKEVADLLEGKYFDFPKPTGLVLKMLDIVTDRNSIIVDFFSGSGTTADSVIRQNYIDSGTRRFILVQIPELCNAKSEAAKAGFSSICDLGEERIRRAGEKIRAEVEESNRKLKIGEEPKRVPDIGFRVLRIDSSNMRDTLATPEETTQKGLFDSADNVKEGRTDEDLLFEVLPKFRIPYSAKIEERTIAGKRCMVVEDGLLVACFDTNVSVDTIEAIAKMEPVYAVMRDASMADDATHANFEELFRTHSPDTVRRVV